MFKRVKVWAELTASEQESLLQRPAIRDNADVAAQAARIIDAVRRDGDHALLEFGARFDGCDLSSLKVSQREFANAESELPPAILEAIDAAIANVKRFHEAQLPGDLRLEVAPGVTCERRCHAIDSVGLYVPAGSAPLPSTAIMLGVPAAIAGCPRRVLCTPPGKSGAVDAATLVAAGRSGITEVFKIGGAQAIAAMAYGTATVPRVDKIFGPGNAWVTAAKSLIAAEPGGASIDMPAGPSELLVVADDSARPGFVAADLLSQAEHGPDSQVILITCSREFAVSVVNETEAQLARLPRREVACSALGNSHAIVAENMDAAIAIANRYAAEHLSLQVNHARDALHRVRNAGSVFLGAWAPESVGDYCSGTNHVLPTYGATRSFSGLGVEQFMRYTTVQELTEDGLRSLAPTVMELAALEGLDAHARAVRVRLT